MGGKGSGGHNKKSAEQHLVEGSYRPDRHGELPLELVSVRRRYAKQMRVESKAVARAKVAVSASGTAANKAAVNSSGIDGLPKCPDWLDEIAKAEWNRAGLELKEKDTLEKTSPAALECYCACYSRWRKAEKRAQDNAECYSPKLIASLTQEAKDTLNQVRAYQNDLGLTPRYAVAIPKPPDGESPMEKHLRETEERMAKGDGR